ncbi:collagen binding domain-containing protein [Edaphobacter sp.]|uniref:MSCRAMM family protein n=1 Tax=Edaphobacter sp. TaxID=1934404 RepID=UPI00345B87B8
MKACRIVFSLLLASISIMMRASPAAPSFRIAGVVLNAATGSPVRECHLEASLRDRFRSGRTLGRSQSSSVSATTDERGHFILEVPSSGAWHLTASATGYVAMSYDAHGMYSSAVVLTAGAPTYDLTFRLPPQGRISGTILDEAGEGVRNATVELAARPLPLPGSAQAENNSYRRITQTDDRGVYEFAGLLPTSYRISVQARPWYTSTTQRRGPSGQTATNNSVSTQQADLDVAYQRTWFPGVTDASQAQLITLGPGDEQRADVQLSPIPAIHLQLIAPSGDEQSGNLSRAAFPLIERIDDPESMGQRFVQVTTRLNSQGQIDVDGLVPGTYRIRMAGPVQDAKDAVVELTQGTTHLVDLRQDSTDLANLTLKFEGHDDEDGQPPMFVTLIDTTTGQRFGTIPGMGMGIMQRGGQGVRRKDSGFSLQVPAGRYEIAAQSRDRYLTGLAAEGAEISGRYLNVHGGNVTLVLRTASGMASVRGKSSSGGRPCVGSVVLLVPAGLDDPGSFGRVVLDQSDTDGSFNFESIVPGQYILISVDHGWTINWNDPLTLRRYLTQGTPLTLGSQSNITQNINAQTP